MKEILHTNGKAAQKPSIYNAREKRLQIEPSRACAGESSVCRRKKGVLQKASYGHAPDTAPPIVHKVLGSQDRPLHPATRAFIEPRFEHDFSRIPAHPKSQTNIQAKLTENAPGDIYEQEADRIADHVMATPAHTATISAKPHIQRFPGQAIGQLDAAPASVDSVLARPGRPLEPALQNEMGERFGHDFSGVRVHSGAAAEQSAREVNASAYTAGHNIVFGAGRFAPGTQEGRRLIAHELTHVVQQSGAEGTSVGHRNGNFGLFPTYHLSNGRPAAIQRDEAGGGSTEFKDTVTTSSRPSSGPGVIKGTVTRTETAPASGSQPRQKISEGKMHIRFDPSDCSVVIPFGYNFVQAARASSTGFCESPPPSTAVPLLPADRFNSLKAGVLADVNRGLNGWFDVRLSGKACPSGCADKTLPIRVDAREDTANPDTTITESSTAAVGPTRAQSAPPRGTGQPQCTRAGIRYWESAMSTLRRTSAFAP